VKHSLFLCAILVVPCGLLSAQHTSSPASRLAALLAEAAANNSKVASANDTWKASTHVAQQVTSLPDPQFTIQSFSVGSPVPFAGFSNSDFAYIGFGASQDLPYRGKLKLKGEVASREAETQKANAAVVSSSVADQIRLLYLRLAYIDAAMGILDRTDDVLQSMIKNALAHYSLGQGSQSVVIKAQLEHTKILREMTMHHGEIGQVEADLKQLLHRAQDSQDIVAEPLAATPIKIGEEELQTLLRNQNPTLRMDAKAVAKQDAQLNSVKRDGKPDFSVGYMFQLTGDDYRNYYMLTVSMRLPRHSRVAAEIAEATEQTNRSRHDLDSDIQQKLADLQKEYVAVKSTAELMDEYKQGLIPQAEAVFRSEQAAYQANKEEFAPVLSSLLELLSIEHDYQEALFEHETAIARIETLTGEALR
jgi:cobalt-zinc-cadmium efflux system outer membrane protein